MRQVVRALLRNDEWKYLLVMHHKSDTWTLPGGHVDKGEAIHKALKREIKEEFNIKMRFLWDKDDFDTEHIKSMALPIAMYKIYYHSTQFGNVKKCEYIFHAETKSTESLKTQDDEIKKYQWCSPEDILKIENIYPQIPKLLHKVIS